MRLNDIRDNAGARKGRMRVGRGIGSGKGKTAGRGTKGTGARKNTPENFEGGQMPLHMRTPKMRGFQNPFRVSYQVVNVAKLAELFPEGGEVGVAPGVAPEQAGQQVGGAQRQQCRPRQPARAAQRDEGRDGADHGKAMMPEA